MLDVFFRWLGVEIQLPVWETIRTWVLRFGFANFANPDRWECADDWIWLIDHSNQIGQEKVLVVLAVRASKLPAPGQALRTQDVCVLAVEPGTKWKQEDVASVLLDLEKRFGTPRSVLSDGATELQEAAKLLKNKGEIRFDVFRDLKHKAANIFKSKIGNSPRFQTFSSQMGTTRSQVQQTELAHLAPPKQKTKARFMNMAATLTWATMIYHVLKHPESEEENGVTAERMEEKFGWLRDYEKELATWSECQRVISIAVKWAAEQGLTSDAVGEFQALIASEVGTLTSPASQSVKSQVEAFISEQASKLKPGERLAISTEVLESIFGQYKCLEGQHSKGGFTSLLAAFPILTTPITAAAISDSFERVSNQDVQTWTREKLGKTVTSKKQSTYARTKKAIKRATENTTMT